MWKGRDERMNWLRKAISATTTLALLAIAGTPAQATDPEGFRPAQVRKAYGIDKLPWDGTGQRIALVGAFDYANAASDLATFIETFGLPTMYGLPGTAACTVDAGPHPCFQSVAVESANQDGDLFWSGDSTWSLELASNVQWAHAIAPGADILMLTAATSQLPDLMKAVDRAVEMGADVVSMSWGFPEEATHVDWNSHFNHPNVMFVAASGNHGTALMYPAASPHVLSVGGTYLDMQWDGTYRSETTFDNDVGGTVGGVSQYQPVAAFQSGLGLSGRSTPDVSWAAGFAGYAVRANGGWINLGGTSLAAPQWAALIALANQAKGGTFIDISQIYAAGQNSQSYYFHDIAEGTGSCQTSDCAAAAGYDFATGWGSPRADKLVPFLAGVPEIEEPAEVIPVATPCAKINCAFAFEGAVRGTAPKGGNWVKMDLQEGHPYQLSAPVSGATYIWLTDAAGRVITATGTSGDDTAYLTWTPPATGTYYFKIGGYHGSIDYTIRIQ